MRGREHTATGAPGGTVTGGLQALIGSSTIEFTLNPAFTASPFEFDVTGAALPTNGVPEPAVSVMVGLGLLGISALRLQTEAVKILGPHFNSHRFQVSE